MHTHREHHATGSCAASTRSRIPPRIDLLYPATRSLVLSTCILLRARWVLSTGRWYQLCRSLPWALCRVARAKRCDSEEEERKTQEHCEEEEEEEEAGGWGGGGGGGGEGEGGRGGGGEVC
eukprot:3194881-Rhodomonas_salina.1